MIPPDALQADIAQATGLVFHDGAFVPVSQVPKRTNAFKILADGVRSHLSLPGFCEPCQVFGAEFETDCWNCGSLYTSRKSAPNPGAVQHTDPGSPNWRQVIGREPWEDMTPLEPYLTRESNASQTPNNNTEHVSEDALLHYLGWSPYGNDS